VRDPARRPWQLAQGLLVVTLLVYGLDAALEQLTASVDLWWHLATGRWIVEHLTIPRHDVFSYTFEGARWIDPEWLSQVLLFSLFRRGGGTALAVFKLLVTPAFLCVAVWAGWRRSGSLVLSVGAGIVAAILCRPFLDIRPDLFLFLGTAVVMAVIHAYRAGARAALLVLLPVTMVLWVNLHASFVFGLGMIGLFTVTELAKASLGLPDAPLPMGRARWLAVAGGAAGLACLLNPEGLTALTFPFVILRPEAAAWRSQTVEWTAPVLFQTLAFNPGFFGWLLVGEALLALAVLIALPRRFDVSDALLVVVTAAMALRARRFVPLVGLVSIPFLAQGLTVLGRRFLPRAAVGVRGAAAVGAACIAAIGWLGWGALPEIRRAETEGLFDRMIDVTYFPRGGVEFLRLNPLPGRLFHLYSWGGYLAFQLPDRKVFIDGRAHTVYPAAFYRADTEAEFGRPVWSTFLDRYEVALVLWETASARDGRQVLYAQLASSPAWARIYDDGDAAVFAHVERGRAWVERFQAFTLAYPAVPRAQFFVGTTYLRAGQFDRARAQLRDVVRQFPEGEAMMRDSERTLAAATASGKAALAWFGVGFYRDVRDDRQGAAGAYEAALARGLAEPHAAYAREALARLREQ
jgi:hypothetical protein